MKKITAILAIIATFAIQAAEAQHSIVISEHLSILANESKPKSDCSFTYVISKATNSGFVFLSEVYDDMPEEIEPSINTFRFLGESFENAPQEVELPANPDNINGTFVFLGDFYNPMPEEIALPITSN